MNRYAAIVVVWGAIASVSFAQSPPEGHPGGRMLDVLRPGMRVQVDSSSGSDPIGIRLEVLNDEGWQELKKNEAAQRQQIAVLERRREDLHKESNAVNEQLNKANRALRTFRPPFSSRATSETGSEGRKGLVELRETIRDLVAKSQELDRQSQEIASQIRGLRDTLPSAYSTIAHVGADYFSVESEYGVKFYPADRIREIYRRKFRPNEVSTLPVEAPRPAT